MNLLIVDDEYYSVDGIARKIEAADLGFAEVFRAYSLAQAQEILSAQAVEVLLTDIEMPKGSGLELVSWVRAQHMPVVCVFLTAFADFGYANAALKLQSLDYLLKPVEEGQLMTCMRHAMEQAAQIAVENEQRLQAGYWVSAQVQLAEQFIVDLVAGSVSQEPGLIRAELSHRHLPPAFADAVFFPVVLRYFPRIENTQWSPNLYEFALKNILTEVLFGEDDAPVIARVTDACLLIAMPGTPPRENLAAECQRALASCERFLTGRFCFFLREPCNLFGLPKEAQALLSFAHNQLDATSRVEDLLTSRLEKRAAPQVPAQRWRELLLERKTEALQGEAARFLKELSHGGTERRDLARFFHDFMQVVYAALDKSGTSAHQLFDNQMPEVPLEKACDSVEHMEAWIQQVLDNYQASMAVAGASEDAVEAVCAYIQSHLDEELTRDRLASAAYLSPDYLSHVFREKKGMPLTAYITERRILRARELLLFTRDSVRDIALSCGFSNLSYFAKQFKRVTGKTPQEYRKEP